MSGCRCAFSRVWLTTRADAYRADAKSLEYAKPGDVTAQLRSREFTASQRRAIADELDQLAKELGEA